ncbi:MAG TPA: hypothetical protein PK546_01570 [Chitinophagales bacterium]|jgi:hypothetical protein|nr:hypothetical protein [Chitinophagales bacterium]HPH86952.1 hypothetical protein [Chitinophagales bacterium]HPN18194.1 hypothetical protein [Chitinophagales bacterium]
MESVQTLNLISGTFAPNEAKEILLEMIKSKINFHNLRNFSSEIRYNRPDLQSKRRIEELTEAKEILLDMISDAKRDSKKIKIEAELLVTFEEE